MSEECKKHRASPIVGPHDCPSCAMEKIRGVNYEVSVENQRLRTEIAELKAGQGEAVAWHTFVGVAKQLLDEEQERLSAEGYLMDSDDCIKVLQESAPPATGVNVPSEFRSVIAMILNALDRDAAEGMAVRGEMAVELRALLGQSQEVKS